MGFQPASSGRLDDQLNELRDGVLHRVRNFTHEYVLNVNVEDLEAALVQGAFHPELVLRFEDKHQHSITQVTYRIPGGGWQDERGTCVTIAIPFEGDASILELRPGSYYYPPEQVELSIIGQDLLVPFSFPDSDANEQRLAARVNAMMKWLNDYTASINDTIRLRNDHLPRMVKEAIESKVAAAKKSIGVVQALGIPMKRAAAPAFAVPAIRRPIPVLAAKPTPAHATAEPYLELEEYDHILGTLRSMSLVIERNPKSFASLDEEVIRDHFLLQLNGTYEGQAIGETFNRGGKTDILIRSADRNVFIAECKFWGGAARFNEAVDQLLSYLTWRDCKVCLMVFNKNKDSMGVAAKMHAAMEAREECRKTLSFNPNGECRYVFVKKEEPSREIIITTQVYDVPSP